MLFADTDYKKCIRSGIALHKLHTVHLIRNETDRTRTAVKEVVFITFLLAHPLALLWAVIFPQVTFLLTEDPNYTTESRGRRRKKRSGREPLPPDRFSLYSSLSSLSGGLTIFTTNSDIHKVSTIVEDNTAVDKVHPLIVIDILHAHLNQIMHGWMDVKNHHYRTLYLCSSCDQFVS